MPTKTEVWLVNLREGMPHYHRCLDLAQVCIDTILRNPVPGFENTGFAAFDLEPVRVILEGEHGEPIPDPVWLRFTRALAEDFADEGGFAPCLTFVWAHNIAHLLEGPAKPQG